MPQTMWPPTSVGLVASCLSLQALVVCSWSSSELATSWSVPAQTSTWLALSQVVSIHGNLLNHCTTNQLKRKNSYSRTQTYTNRGQMCSSKRRRASIRKREIGGAIKLKIKKIRAAPTSQFLSQLVPTAMHSCSWSCAASNLAGIKTTRVLWRTWRKTWKDHWI